MGMISGLALKLGGWKIVGTLPNDKKYILIVAPHTSNWDLIVGLLARFYLNVKIRFLIKQEVFFFPLGSLLTALGGIPIDRKSKGNTVADVVKLFKENEQLALALTPEGTRGPVSRWKEGFYHMACKAQVPLVPVGFDYKAKEIRIDQPFTPTGSINDDFPKLLMFFRTIKGHRPKIIPDYQPKE